MARAEDDQYADEIRGINAYHAARVRQLRAARGWSQRELAARLEPPAAQSSINEWEKPDHETPLRTKARLARAFGLTIAEAFGLTWEHVDDQDAA